MEFNRLIFIFLLMPLLVTFNYFIKKTYRPYFLLLISLFFYFLFEPLFIFLLIAIIIITYLIGLRVKNNKYLYFLHLFIIFALLFFFKFNTRIFNILKLDFASIALPLGYSFYSFMSISYISDVYYNKIEKETNPFKLASYLSLFITIGSGPINTYDYFKKESNLTLDNIASGLRRFIMGLAKKVILSANLAQIVSALNEHPYTLSFTSLIILIFVQGLELYFDFSGYSDMAIGLGEMMGIKIRENFNYPYTAKSIKAFWSSWHMSLGNFFKNYIYIPLGGSRKGKLRLALNIFIVWTITGIWHGDTLNYLLWAYFLALALMIEKMIKIKLPNFLAFTFTQITIFLSWLIFHTPNGEILAHYFKVLMFKGPKLNFILVRQMCITHLWYIVLIAILASTPILYKLYKKIENRSLLLADLTLICLFFLAIFYIITGTFKGSAYFNF